MELLGMRFHTGPDQWHHMASLGLGQCPGIRHCLYRHSHVPGGKKRRKPAPWTACAAPSLELEARSVDDFIDALSQPLGPITATREVEMALRDLRLPRTETRPYALRRLRDQLETNLSGLLGPSVSHQLMDDHLPYLPEEEQSSSEDIQFIESRLDNIATGCPGWPPTRRPAPLHQQTLLELPMGVISLGADDEIIGWNQAMEAHQHQRRRYHRVGFRIWSTLGASSLPVSVVTTTHTSHNYLWKCRARPAG